jgi:hypothetical protein
MLSDYIHHKITQFFGEKVIAELKTKNIDRLLMIGLQRGATIFKNDFGACSVRITLSFFMTSYSIWLFPFF